MKQIYKFSDYIFESGDLIDINKLPKQKDIFIDKKVLQNLLDYLGNEGFKDYLVTKKILTFFMDFDYAEEKYKNSFNKGFNKKKFVANFEKDVEKILKGQLIDIYANNSNFIKQVSVSIFIRGEGNNEDKIIDELSIKSLEKLSDIIDDNSKIKAFKSKILKKLNEYK